MTTTQTECFLAAAECLNFTAAAEKLFMSQPALSRSISTLENELGLPLFIRDNNTVSLSPGGVVFYDWLVAEKRSFLSMLNDAKRIGSNKSELKMGYVRNEILRPEYASSIVEFQKTYPDVELSLTQYDRAIDLMDSLRSHDLDMAFVVGSTISYVEDIIHLDLNHYQRCLVVSPLHRCAGKRMVSLADMSGETFISIDTAQSPSLTPVIRQLCLSCGFDPVITEMPGIDELISMVSVNKGISILYDGHAEKHNPMLHFIGLEGDFPINIICAWHNTNDNPNIEKMADCLKKTIA